jgi:hypothetical protein
MERISIGRLLMLLCLVQSGSTLHQAAAQQGVSNLWMGGYVEAGVDTALGGVDLNFISGDIVITTVDHGIDFFRTSANITDSVGNLLFSTNGAYIANATGDTMLNGGGLSPSWYTSIYPDGLNLSQACMILPKPDAPGLYYLFHGTLDDAPNSNALFLYLTTIDMALDGGLGGVVSKNQVLIADTLNTGKITAVRHANGRDWWVFCHKLNTDTYYRLLVTPNGVSLDGTQAIGEIRPRDVGQVCFSPDGSKFAYYYGANTDLEVFDFDRCTGLLSNPVHITIDDSNFAGGVAFSPNSRYLYVSSSRVVYQYDVEAPDIETSMVQIAEWDSTYSPFPPFSTKFDLAQLAPDGQVYIATGNTTLRLHVIHNPNEPGLACNMEQHGVELPRFFANSLPNHPNYFLGPVDGSVCDSLGINTLTSTLSRGAGVVRAFPNPSADGHFVLRYPANAGVGWLEVRDIAGRVMLRERIPQWSTVHAVELLGPAAGMYQCTLRWGVRSVSTRLVITP